MTDDNLIEADLGKEFSECETIIEDILKDFYTSSSDSIRKVSFYLVL